MADIKEIQDEIIEEFTGFDIDKINVYVEGVRVID